MDGGYHLIWGVVTRRSKTLARLTPKAMVAGQVIQLQGGRTYDTRCQWGGWKASFIGMHLGGKWFFWISEFWIHAAEKLIWQKGVTNGGDMGGEGIIHRDAFAREVMLLEGGRQLDPSLFFLDTCVGPYIWWCVHNIYDDIKGMLLLIDLLLFFFPGCFFVLHLLCSEVIWYFVLNYLFGIWLVFDTFENVFLAPHTNSD